MKLIHAKMPFNPIINHDLFHSSVINPITNHDLFHSPQIKSNQILFKVSNVHLKEKKN